MKIPVLSEQEIGEFVSSMIEGENYEPRVAYLGGEDTLKESDFEELVNSLHKSFSSARKTLGKSQTKRVEQLEVELGAKLRDFFHENNVEIFYEPGFWSYLSFRCREIILWRLPEKNPNGLKTNFVQKHSPSELRNAFLPRVLARSLIVEGEEELEGYIAQDFWQSHILRVKTGFSPVLSKQFAKAVLHNKIGVDLQRSAAKRIRSIRSNVLFEILDEQQARELVDAVLGNRRS